MENLTPQQEKFCRCYTQNQELFGNATLSYAEGYGFDLDNAPRNDAIYDTSTKEKLEDSTYDKMYNTCSVGGSRLLRNDKIDKRVRELLNEMLLDEVIDAQLVSIILKGAKDADRISGIREYNKLKQRVTDKLDLTTLGEKINISPEHVALAKKYEEELKGKL